MNSRAWPPLLFVAFGVWLGAMPRCIQATYQYTEAKTEGYFDVRRISSPELVFNVTVSAGSPPDGNLIFVGIFNENEIDEVHRLDLRSIDNSGMELRRMIAKMGPADISAFEKLLAQGTTLSDFGPQLPLLRHMAMMASIGSGGPGPGTRITTDTFRLPPPPVSWTFGTPGRYLRFRFTRIGTATVAASLDTTY
jgi:hypothetical protein